MEVARATGCLLDPCWWKGQKFPAAWHRLAHTLPLRHILHIEHIYHGSSWKHVKKPMQTHDEMERWVKMISQTSCSQSQPTSYRTSNLCPFQTSWADARLPLVAKKWIKGFCETPGEMKSPQEPKLKDTARFTLPISHNGNAQLSRVYK